MKKLILCLTLISFLTACKGKKGDRGPSGPGTMSVYAGLITSDTQVISVPAYTSSSGINVLVGNGVNFTSAPYYVPSLGMNVFYAASYAVVDIYNAKSAAATHYKIVVINNASGSSLHDRLLP